MPKTRQQKEESVAQLSDQLSRMKAVVFAKYDGLTVNEVNELRQTLRKENVDYTVAKKTLLRLATKQANLDPQWIDALEGSVALAFGYEDEVLAAKLLSAFSKKHPAIQLAGGVVQGRLLSGVEVVALSKLPSREQLLGQVVGSINAPVSGFVSVLAGNLRGLINVLQAYQEKQPAHAG